MWLTCRKSMYSMGKMSTYTKFPPPLPTYGGKYVITMLPGKGVGPELMDSVKAIYAEIGVPIDFQEFNLKKANFEDDELELFQHAVRRNVVAISGNIGTHTHLNFDLNMYQNLKLNQNITHVKSIPTIPAKFSDVDVVIIRQNSLGEYSMLEHSPAKGVVTYLKIMSREIAMEVLDYAFQFAKFYKRKKITAIHKANIMKMTDGLFLNCAKETAKKYPEVQMNDMIVDNACMQIVKDPKQFDVIVTTNLYGAITRNIFMGITGSQGLTPAVNVGEDAVIFEAASRPVFDELAGKNLVNPLCMINSSRNLMEYLGFKKHATLLQDAIDFTILKEKIRTPDIGGKHKSSDVTNSIIKYIIQNKQHLLHF